MSNPSHTAVWLRRFYVPVATLILLAVANRAVRGLDFDPLTAAQNPRLSFAGSAPRTAAGFALVRPLFRPGDPNSVLTSAIPLNTPDTLSAFFLGNSQTIAIMDEQPGDELAPVWLSARLNGDASGARTRFPLRLGSEPNLRMSELLVKSVLSGTDADRRVDVVIFGIVLDGLRWVDPREDVVALAKDPGLRHDLEGLVADSSDLPDAARLVRDILEGAREDAAAASDAAAEGVAARAEDRIQARLEAALPLFAERKSAYGLLLTRFLEARNRLFRIRTDTRRPIPQAMYRANLQIVELALRYLARHHIHAVGYFAPIRPIEPGPYEPADVVRFRKDLKDLCVRNGALEFDYSELVPEEMWTNYPDTEAPVSGQRDFAHFTGRAHQRLGERLAADLRPWFEKWLAEKQGRAPGDGRMARAAEGLP